MTTFLQHPRALAIILPVWRVITLVYAFGSRLPAVIAIIIFRNTAAVIQALASIVCAVLHMPAAFLKAYQQYGALKRAITELNRRRALQAAVAPGLTERN